MPGKKLESEIKENENIGKLVSIIHRYGHMFFQKECENDEIGGGQIFFLLELIHKNGINQEMLASELSFDKGTTARAVKHLESSGFIERRIDQTDRRAYKLYTTDKADQFYQGFQRTASEWENILTKGLNSDEVTLLREMMDKIVGNVQEYREIHKLKFSK